MHGGRLVWRRPPPYRLVEVNNVTANDRDGTVLLEVSGVEVVYNAAVHALGGVDLEVHRGQIVALLGANGAGKTTLLRAITGLLGFHDARMTAGDITLSGRSIRRRSAAHIVRQGIGQVMEGRRIFAELSVGENLACGAISVRDKSATVATRDRVLELFPVLERRLDQQAGYLSGGEQQMLAIGRALMSQPSLLVLDEPSLGLAPQLVETIRMVITDINATGTTVLLVEQNAAMALAIADTAYVLEHGVVARSGQASALRDDPEVQALYLGVGTGGKRRTYRREFEAHRLELGGAAGST